jgi:hypothetical protein
MIYEHELYEAKTVFIYFLLLCLPFVCLFAYFLRQGLTGPDWPQTHNPPVSASQGSELQARATAPGPVSPILNTVL